MSEEEQLYQENLRLSQIEYRLQRLYLRSRPRTLGLVLSNRCNIGCIHCYQAKNGDNLLRPAEIGRDLRREFSALYPFLSALEVQGGEVFVTPGFPELLDDLAATVQRPVLRIATNAILIDECWAERIVRARCRNLTVSIDGGTPETYARLRRGGDLEAVLAGVRRVRKWKEMLGSEFPYLDSFFVVMRSNFREIPQYLDLIRREGIRDVSLQTVHTNHENTSRFPTLVEDEVIAGASEVAALHSLLRATLNRERTNFRRIRVSGMATLFNAHGLDGAFLHEELDGLYPDSDDLRSDAGFELCPNPWTTMFVAENGDVHLCFLSEPIGNLYQTPLPAIWNSPRALAKRSHMAAGRYLASGCSKEWCSWREGTQCSGGGPEEIRLLLAEMDSIHGRAMQLRPNEADETAPLAAVRRMLSSREQNFAEFESLFQQLCETNRASHESAQSYINQLESELANAKRERDSPLVRMAMKLSELRR